MYVYTLHSQRIWCSGSLEIALAWWPTWTAGQGKGIRGSIYIHTQCHVLITTNYYVLLHINFRAAYIVAKKKKDMAFIPTPIPSFFSTNVAPMKNRLETSLHGDEANIIIILPFSQSLFQSDPLWPAELSSSRRSVPRLASLLSSGQWHEWPPPSDPAKIRAHV